MSSKEINTKKEKKPHLINEETRDFIEKIFIEQKVTDEYRLEYYGRCVQCKEIQTWYTWCRRCNATHFANNFTKWTSGNKEIDHFVQNTQIYAWKWDLVLEWYPWETFSDIEEIGKGGYGTVFCARTKVQRIKKSKSGLLKKTTWRRWKKDDGNPYNQYVALKRMEPAETTSKNVLNEAKRLQRWAYQSSYFNTLHGFTKDESTGQYLLVLKYFEKGDLRKKLRHAADWEEKIKIISSTTVDMNDIHKAGMIHRNLHPGNVLCSKDCSIADLGLAIFESEASSIKDIQGVMPYMAPELLSGRGSYSRATDVYAFGMIMWEISSGEKPFHEISHDARLALQICRGRRPEITNDTPSFYRDLMVKCWHANPAKRPSAKEISKLTEYWYEIYKCSPRIKDQTLEAEEIRRQNRAIKKKTNTHSGAIYTSRLLTHITRELVSMNFDQNS